MSADLKSKVGCHGVQMPRLQCLRPGDSEHRAIYKPIRGERPLWDLPGLHRRERAAYVVSESLGVGAVPPTVIRDGPLGVGSVQWFVDADHSEHYFTIYESRDDLHDQLRGIAILDLAANNTDRKSGHCLLAHDHVWAIDNGLCFSADYKPEPSSGTSAESRLRLSIGRLSPTLQITHQRNSMSYSIVTRFKHYERLSTHGRTRRISNRRNRSPLPWPLVYAC